MSALPQTFPRGLNRSGVMGYALSLAPKLLCPCVEASGVTLADISPNANDLTLTGSPTLAVAGPIARSAARALTTASGKYGSRTSSVLGNSPALWTMAVWVNGAAADNSTVFCVASSVSANPFLNLRSGASAVGQATNKICCHVRNDAGASAVGLAAGDAAGVAFDSTWHHVAAAYDGTNMRLYLDGAVTLTSGNFAAPTLTLNRTGLGAMIRSSVTNPFAGSLAMPFASLTCLTTPQINALYLMGKNGT